MSDDEMGQLLAAIEDRIGSSWVEAAEWLRDTNQLDEVAERVRAGDFEGAVRGVEQAAVRVANSIQSAYVDSAGAAADFIDDIKPGKLVSFNSTNRRAAEWAASNRAEMVREVTSETRRVIANVVSRGVNAGTNPRQVAVAIRDSIGLTEAQEQHVSNYRRALQDGDWGNALDRALRDKRSDRALRRLAEDGGGLPQERIDRMVDTYRANYVAHRAEVIARTEGLRALHEGTEEMYAQAIEDGTMAADELMQEWHSAADGRVRDSHTRVRDAETDAVTKPIGVGYWRTRDGNLLRYPGDPEAPAEDVIQCRCVVSTVVNPSVLPTGDAPAGFSDMGRQVRVGIPKADDIRPAAVYRVPVSDIRSKLLAPPGVEDTQNQTQSIRDAWTDGRKLQPTKVLINGDGTYYVVDGRHRLQVAMEQDRDVLIEFGRGAEAAPSDAVRLTPTPKPVPAPTPTPTATTDLPSKPPKNQKRVAAAKKAGEASALRRREIYSTVVSNLPDELQATWAKEGNKYMREQAARIKGIKDPVIAGSKISESFIETYGSGESTAFGNEGDRYSRRTEIQAEAAESWADDQESRYYARMQREAVDGNPTDDEEVPF